MCRSLSIKVLRVRSTLKTPASGLAAGRARSKVVCRLAWECSKRSTPYATPSRMSPRRKRSTASSRSTSSSRTARPRGTVGASSAGPLPCGGPTTKVAQRRQRQASPA